MKKPRGESINFHGTTLIRQKPHSYTSINVRLCNGRVPFRPT